MNTLIVGATAGLGRALAAEWASRGHALVLGASDIRDLEALAADLRIRHNCRVGVVALDLRSPDLAALRLKCAQTFDGLDALLLPAGVGDPDQDRGPVSDEFMTGILRVNLESIARIVNLFLPDLMQRPGSLVAGFGSVAAAIPRGRNQVYASAKRGLEFYFGTLQSYSAGRSPRILFYRLGYMRTGLTFGEVYRLPVADPAVLAVRIFEDCRQRQGFFWLPRWWRLIMLVFALIPQALRVRLEGAPPEKPLPAPPSVGG